MLERILRFSLRARWAVIAVTACVAALGAYNLARLPIDAVPDITNVQVQINSEAPGMSPMEVEQRITFPVETGQARQRGLDRERDSLLDLERREAGRLGVDLHLDVGDVGYRVDRQMLERVSAQGGHERRRKEDQPALANREAKDTFEHDVPPPLSGRGSRRTCRRLP